MNWLERSIAAVSPGLAARRQRARREFAVARLQTSLAERERAQMSGGHHDAAGGGRRAAEFRRNRTDAYLAARAERMPIAWSARDLLRNNPRVVRATHLISNYTVGAGIVPTVRMVSEEDQKTKDRIEGLIRDHLLTSAIDADGHYDLRGLQQLGMKTIPVSGEVLCRVRWRRSADKLPLPFQIQMLEPDFLADSIDGDLRGGARIEEGIEYDVIGRVQAYHLYRDHPGGARATFDTVRIPAEAMAHGFLAQRPGQRRGVSWFAPVMGDLVTLHKFMQATLKRQEVAAMFAAFVTSAEDGQFDDLMADGIEAGSIMELSNGETVNFSDPPQAQSLEPVIRAIDRTIASGLMIPVEALTGDYTGLNYSGGRMARMDTDPAVAAWQQHVAIGQMLRPIGGWFREAIWVQEGIDPASYVLEWTPPRRAVVDPTKEFPALERRALAGFGSRRQTMRELGYDPAAVEAEILEERQWAKDHGLAFSTDAGSKSTAASLAGDDGTTEDEGKGSGNGKGRGNDSD